MYKAYKYRLYPNAAQQVLIDKHIGACRWIYNYGLDKKTKAYQLENKALSRFDIQSDLPLLKKSEDTSWLKEINSQSLQAALENLDKAFTKFYKEKKGYPKFKSKHSPHQSYNIPQNTRVFFDRNRITVPKIKSEIKCILHRRFDGTIKTSTISRTPTGKYYISILVELNESQPKKRPIDESQAIGIDLGIKTFATLSNNITIENNRFLKKSLKKLKRLQRKASKRQKGSNNRAKANKLIARLHEKISNQRLDFIHKVTHTLVTEYDTLCLETLGVSNMIKNHKLAQALSDVSLGKFNEILNYKSEWYGCNILRIGRFEPSSKMCTCGTVNTALTLKDRTWTCSSCGETHDRDLLAANNIRRFAFTKNNTVGTTGINACGDGALAPSANQETPTLT